MCVTEEEGPAQTDDVEIGLVAVETSTGDVLYSQFRLDFRVWLGSTSIWSTSHFFLPTCETRSPNLKGRDFQQSAFSPLQNVVTGILQCMHDMIFPHGSLVSCKDPTRVELVTCRTAAGCSTPELRILVQSFILP